MKNTLLTCTTLAVMTSSSLAGDIPNNIQVPEDTPPAAKQIVVPDGGVFNFLYKRKGKVEKHFVDYKVIVHPATGCQYIYGPRLLAPHMGPDGQTVVGCKDGKYKNGLPQ